MKSVEEMQREIDAYEGALKNSGNICRDLNDRMKRARTALELIAAQPVITVASINGGEFQFVTPEVVEWAKAGL